MVGKKPTNHIDRTIVITVIFSGEAGHGGHQTRARHRTTGEGRD